MLRNDARDGAPLEDGVALCNRDSSGKLDKFQDALS